MVQNDQDPGIAILTRTASHRNEWDNASSTSFVGSVLNSIKVGGVILSHFVDARVAMIVLLVCCFIQRTPCILMRIFDANGKACTANWFNVILSSLAFETPLEVTKSIYAVHREVRIPSNHQFPISYIPREINLESVTDFKVLASPGLSNPRQVVHQEHGNDIVIRFNGPESLRIKNGVQGTAQCMKFVQEITKYDARAPLGGEERGSFPLIALFFPVLRVIRELSDADWQSSIEIVGIQAVIAASVSAILRSFSLEFHP